MTIEDQIRYKKLQYNINREVAKISASYVKIFLLVCSVFTIQ